MKKLLYTLMIPFTFFFVGCDEDDDVAADTNLSLTEAAQNEGLTTLLDAVGAVDGLAVELTSANGITVFAPNNAAFAAALEANGAVDLNGLVEVLGGVDQLQAVLQYHVVSGAALSSSLEDGQTLTTLQGQELTVAVNADGVFISDYFGYSYRVAKADISIDNGVIHVIEGVLMPDLREGPNVVEAATSAGLTTLIDAVVAAGLKDDLLQAKAITVFAPTNNAFANLLVEQGVTDLNGLIAKLGADAVVKVLQFHVVPAVVFAANLTEGDQTVQTLAGETLTILKTGESVTVIDASGQSYNVTIADVTIENGVVHVINGVLLPTL